jgi:hypothetical protein
MIAISEALATIEFEWTSSFDLACLKSLTFCADRKNDIDRERRAVLARMPVKTRVQ